MSFQHSQPKKVAQLTGHQSLPSVTSCPIRRVCAPHVAFVAWVIMRLGQSTTLPGMLLMLLCAMPCHAMPLAVWTSLLTFKESKSAETDLKHAAVGNCAGAATALMTFL